LSHLGLTRTLLKQNDRGMAALQQNICYKRELRSGDIVTIRSGVMEMKEKTMRLCHHMTNDETGEIVASTEITGVYMDTTNRRSCLFPAHIFERSGFVHLAGCTNARVYKIGSMQFSGSSRRTGSKRNSTPPCSAAINLPLFFDLFCYWRTSFTILSNSACFEYPYLQCPR
jgi:hypothetical protein